MSMGIGRAGRSLIAPCHLRRIQNRPERAYSKPLKKERTLTMSPSARLAAAYAVLTRSHSAPRPREVACGNGWAGIGWAHAVGAHAR